LKNTVDHVRPRCKSFVTRGGEEDECGGRYESVYALRIDPIVVCNHD
jgi:hypothetical protein